MTIQKDGSECSGTKKVSSTDPVGVQYIAYTLYQDTPDPLTYSFKTEFSRIPEKLWKTLKLIK